MSQKGNNRARVYFPGLNGLRFFAALAVLVTHVELLKGNQGYSNVWKNPFIFQAGGLGVVFFFVLSGFLITYLLFREESATGTISVKDFYLRRIFRIWPLYYFVTVLVFFLLPSFEFFQLPYYTHHFEQNFDSALWMYVFMLPNLAMAMFPPVPLGGQLWSIGVEEQFYLMWPALIKYARKALRTILITGVVVIGVKGMIWGLYQSGMTYWWLEVLKSFLAMSKLECMVIGGIGAYWLFTDRLSILRPLFDKRVQAMAYLLIPLMIWVLPDAVQDVGHLLFSCCFLIIILNVSSNQGSLVKLEHKVLNYLGKISYGIYMYHFIAILIVLKGLEYTEVRGVSPEAWNVLVYAGSILLTIMMSGLSYAFFEKPFLKLKVRFSRVISGDFSKPGTA